MTYLGLMEAEAERRETQAAREMGRGLFSCGGNSVSNSMSPGQRGLFVSALPGAGSAGRQQGMKRHGRETWKGRFPGPRGWFYAFSIRANVLSQEALKKVLVNFLKTYLFDCARS